MCLVGRVVAAAAPATASPELVGAVPGGVTVARTGVLLHPAGGDHSGEPTLDHPGAITVGGDEVEQRLAGRAPPGPYVARADLALLDQDVGVQRDPEQVIGG